MRVAIKDFQNIRKAVFDIKGLTLLIGQSSQGKSACLRAIYAATHNRFKTGMVRHGEEAAIVKLAFSPDDPPLAVRKTGKGSAVMLLGDMKFEKLGRDVPPEVEEYCNFGYIEVGTDKFDINFYSQFDKPLLLAFSQKRVMELLSASKALDDLNSANKVVSEKRTLVKGEIKSLDTLLSENKAQLTQLRKSLRYLTPLMKNLNSAYDEVVKQESTITVAKEAQERLIRLNLLQVREKSLRGLKRKLEAFFEDKEKERGLKEVREGLRKRDEIQRRSDVLTKICSKDIPAMYARLSSLKSLRTLLTAVDEEKVAKAEKRATISKSLLSLSEELKGYKEKHQEALRLKEKLEEVERSINTLNRIVQEKRCPTCGQKIKATK